MNTSETTAGSFQSGRGETNPYRIAALLTWQRLKWDLKPESWRSRRILEGWKNRHVGKKAVIVCNGPSLLRTELDLLQGVFTIGMNKINLLFDKSSFRPSCIAAVNAFVIQQNAEFFNETDVPLFLDSCAAGFIGARTNVAFLHHSGGVRFARDCSVSINQGYTVTYVAMQLAFHMGFTNVALVGCDHNYAVSGPANKTVEAGEKDESHFDPNYFAGGMKWQLPDLYQSEISYNLARETFLAAGREIVNATEGGRLDLFPRVSLRDFLAR